MATLTKKDLLEAIEDMPENIEVWTQTNALCYEVNRVELKTLWVGKENSDFISRKTCTIMLENKDYCDYETCVALKELGYNRGAYAYYFPNHKEDLIFNTHQMRGCSINEMLKGYNTYPKDVMGHELIDAPTMWEAQKFLREEKGIFVYIDVPWKTDSGLGWSYFCCNRPMTEEDKEVCFASGGFYDSYEEALLEGIRCAVKILKENETIHR